MLKVAGNSYKAATYGDGFLAGTAGYYGIRLCLLKICVISTY
jgi:hypothetical protein